MPNDAGTIDSPRLLGFCGGPLDRAAVFRADHDWIAARRRAPGAKMLRLNGDKTRLADGRLAYEAEVAEEAIFLGLDGSGDPIFAGETTNEISDEGSDLRSLAMQGLVPPGDLAILAQARSLLHWH